MSGQGALEGLKCGVLVAALLVPVVFWLWTVLDCARRDFRDAGTKIGWLVVIVVLGVIGSVLYLALGRHTGTGRNQGT